MDDKDVFCNVAMALSVTTTLPPEVVKGKETKVVGVVVRVPLPAVELPKMFVTAFELMLLVATTFPFKVICEPLNEMLVLELPNAKSPVWSRYIPEPVMDVPLIAAVFAWYVPVTVRLPVLAVMADSEPTFKFDK